VLKPGCKKERTAAGVHRNLQLQHPTRRRLPAAPTLLDVPSIRSTELRAIAMRDRSVTCSCSLSVKSQVHMACVFASPSRSCRDAHGLAREQRKNVQALTKMVLELARVYSSRYLYVLAFVLWLLGSFSFPTSLPPEFAFARVGIVLVRLPLGILSRSCPFVMIGGVAACCCTWKLMKMGTCRY
jgi:hypothetical protein